MYQTDVNPPFQARKVDTVMRSRKAPSEQPNSEENSSTSELPVNRESSNELSTTAQLEQLRPRDLKSWLEFRVRYIILICGHNDASCAVHVLSVYSQPAIFDRPLDSEGRHIVLHTISQITAISHLISFVRGPRF